MRHLNDFAIYLKVEKDLSPNTIAGYIKDTEKFIEHIDCSIEEVTPTEIRSYIAHLTDLGNKRNTTSRSLCALKSFFGYLRDIAKVIATAPTDEVKLNKREKSLPKALSKTDTMKLLATASQEGIKCRLIVELLYGLGGRVSEIASMRVEDIDFDESYILLHGKGSKERQNPIHPECIELIRRYMKGYKITSGYLFPHRFDKEKHQTRESIFLRVKSLAEKAGLDKSTVSPHAFRHSYATHMLDNGCDMAMLQEFLGHEDIATTKIYAKVTRGNKQSNFNKFHPLSR